MGGEGWPEKSSRKWHPWERTCYIGWSAPVQAETGLRQTKSVPLMQKGVQPTYTLDSIDLHLAPHPPSCQAARRAGGTATPQSWICRGTTGQGHAPGACWQQSRGPGPPRGPAGASSGAAQRPCRFCLRRRRSCRSDWRCPTARHARGGRWCLPAPIARLSWRIGWRLLSIQSDPQTLLVR